MGRMLGLKIEQPCAWRAEGALISYYIHLKDTESKQGQGPTVCAARIKNTKGSLVGRQRSNKQGTVGGTFHEKMLTLEAIDFLLMMGQHIDAFSAGEGIAFAIQRGAKASADCGWRTSIVNDYRFADRLQEMFVCLIELPLLDQDLPSRLSYGSHLPIPDPAGSR